MLSGSLDWIRSLDWTNSSGIRSGINFTPLKGSYKVSNLEFTIFYERMRKTKHGLN